MMMRYFGAYDSTDWQVSVNGNAAYAAIDKAAGQAMSLTSPQLSWANGLNVDGSPRMQRLYLPRLQADRNAGRLSALTWISFNLGHPEQNSLFSLPYILNGGHDAYLAQFGQDALSFGDPFIVRLDPEMNGWWEGPFSEYDGRGNPANGNSPGQYAQMFRYVVRKVRAAGGTNILWHWCPNVVDPSPTSTLPTSVSRLASFYPGDDVVDFVGTDVYNWAVSRGYPWLSFSQCLEGAGSICGNTWSAVNAIAPTKPWLLGEVGSELGPGDRAAWIVDMFNTIPERYPSIWGLTWFNWSTDNAHWAFDPAALTAWGKGASSNAWVKAGSPPSDTAFAGRFVPLVLQERLITVSHSASNVATSAQSVAAAVNNLAALLKSKGSTSL
jgi:hypothetical protein